MRLYADSAVESLTFLESPSSLPGIPTHRPCMGRRVIAAALVLLVSAGVSAACIGVAISQGGECRARTTPVPDLITGEYQLEYYDEEYSHFLSAMGVPQSVQSLILTV